LSRKPQLSWAKAGTDKMLASSANGNRRIEIPSLMFFVGRAVHTPVCSPGTASQAREPDSPCGF
jgi:hypothetical protein